MIRQAPLLTINVSVDCRHKLLGAACQLNLPFAAVVGIDDALDQVPFLHALQDDRGGGAPNVEFIFNCLLVGGHVLLAAQVVNDVHLKLYLNDR